MKKSLNSSNVGPSVQHGDSLFALGINNMDLINRKMAWFLHSGLSDSDCCKVNIPEL